MNDFLLSSFAVYKYITNVLILNSFVYIGTVVEAIQMLYSFKKTFDIKNIRIIK